MPPITTTMQPIPYLAFAGNCAEAFQFYVATFGATIVSKMTYGDMPEPYACADSAKNRIANIMIEMPGGGFFYGSDCPEGMPYNGIHGMSLALNFADSDEGQTVFDKLADGGTVTMPYGPTFWAEKFGMVTDKFGVHWMVNGNLQ